MTEPFKASNGIEITLETDGGGDVYLVGRRDRYGDGRHLDTYANAGPEGIVALREFFRHERDEANAVWRSQIDPTWTAVHEKGYPTVQFRNDDGMREFSVYPNRSNLHAWSIELQDIALEYLDAHPEPKPWLTARTGEVWVLSTADGETAAYAVMSVRESGIVFESHEGRYSLSDADIENARRIWPEDAS